MTTTPCPRCSAPVTTAKTAWREPITLESAEGMIADGALLLVNGTAVERTPHTSIGGQRRTRATSAWSR